MAGPGPGSPGLEDELMAFSVQVSHGSEKHRVELAAPTSTVEALRESLREITGIPPESQKIIFKGKTLRDGSKTVGEVGMKEGSKAILLGRQYTLEQETSLKPLNEISKSVDGIERKMEEIRDELDGIEKGFLQAELVPEACRGLDKRCAACGEMLMQSMEKVDAVDIPASETLVRGKRKSAVVRIQLPDNVNLSPDFPENEGLLEKTDELAKRIEKCRNPSS